MLSSLLITPVPSNSYRFQVVYMASATNAFFLVGAAALFGPRKLGRRVATQVSLTYLLYLFSPVRTPCQLPADGILSRPFAPAR